MRFESLSDLEEDLDCLLKIEEGEATARRGAPVFDNFSDFDNNAMPLLGSHHALIRWSPRSENHINPVGQACVPGGHETPRTT
jgi:hypothetical protein